MLFLFNLPEVNSVRKYKQDLKIISFSFAFFLLPSHI